jgi:hypothetical protein
MQPALALMLEAGMKPEAYLSLKDGPKTYLDLGLSNHYILKHLCGMGYTWMVKRQGHNKGLWGPGPKFPAFKKWYQKRIAEVKN